jgi:hypothetical protein
VCEAHQRGLAILPEYLDQKLADAEKRLAGGDLRVARHLALQALAETPVEPDYSQTLERILRALPPGPIHTRDQLRTKAWLVWARRECLLSGCPLPRAVIQRLRALSQYETSADRAWVAELAGDTYAAESHERDALVPNAPEWTHYLLLKARRLATSGRAAEAAAHLALIDRDADKHAPHQAVHALVERNLGLSSTRLRAPWHGARNPRGGDAFIEEFFWLDPPEKIRLHFGPVTPGGAAVQILWSSQLKGCHPVESGSILTLDAPRSRGFQILEARPLPGARIELADVQVVN